MTRLGSRRGQSGAPVVAILILVLGGVLDAVVIGPLFDQLTAGTSRAGWSAATVFLYFTVLPYVFSTAIVAAVVGGLFGRH